MYWKVGITPDNYILYKYFAIVAREVVNKEHYNPIQKRIIYPKNYMLIVKLEIFESDQEFLDFYKKEQPLKIRKLLE